MVTWEADRARAGTSVTAVAPLPMTTIRLPGEVEPLGPGLRVHDGAGEVVHAFEIGQVPVVVAVVAAAGEEEARRELDGLVVSVRSAVMRQSESGVDQSAAMTRWLKRMWASTPDSPRCP